MPTASLPTYSLQIRKQHSGPVYTVMFRWPAGRQVKRTIGPAWTKRGRPPEGHLDAALAHDRAREIVREHVASSERRHPQSSKTLMIAVSRLSTNARPRSTTASSAVRSWSCTTGKVSDSRWTKRRTSVSLPASTLTATTRSPRGA